MNLTKLSPLTSHIYIANIKLSSFYCLSDGRWSYVIPAHFDPVATVLKPLYPPREKIQDVGLWGAKRAVGSSPGVSDFLGGGCKEMTYKNAHSEWKQWKPEYNSKAY